MKRKLYSVQHTELRETHHDAMRLVLNIPYLVRKFVAPSVRIILNAYMCILLLSKRQIQNRHGYCLVVYRSV